MKLPLWRSQNQATYFFKNKNFVKSVRKQYGSSDWQAFKLFIYSITFYSLVSKKPRLIGIKNGWKRAYVINNKNESICLSV